MFSITTMASSTTKPVEMVRAMRERLSMVYPAKYIIPKVPTNESGTAMLGMDVAQILRRKKKTTKMTRTTEMMRVTSISWTEARIVIVRSCETLIWMDGGIEAWSSGKRARTRSTVAIVFADGWR